jgi:hypothetical protein
MSATPKVSSLVIHLSRLPAPARWITHDEACAIIFKVPWWREAACRRRGRVLRIQQIDCYAGICKIARQAIIFRTAKCGGVLPPLHVVRSIVPAWRRCLSTLNALRILRHALRALMSALPTLMITWGKCTSERNPYAFNDGGVRFAEERQPSRHLYRRILIPHQCMSTRYGWALTRMMT